MAIKLTEDFNTHFRKCMDVVMNFEGDRFSVDAFNVLYSLNIESPIEQILYVSLRALSRITWHEKNFENTPDGAISTGLHIFPQYEIGKYRVDFLVEFRHIDYLSSNDSINVLKKSVIVECDSQQFHDRTEQERRYEKKRDRFLQQQGYKIFHFTGKEIKDEPFRISAEILAFVTDESAEEILQSDFLN